MNNRTIRKLTLTGLMTAIICLAGPIALYIPLSPVPVSMGTLAIYFAVSVLGMRQGTMSVIIYILLGLVGVPIFTGFTAGPGTLLGPTGGYIVGYIFMALICGFFADKFSGKLPLCFLGMLLGTSVCYAFGSFWLGQYLEIAFTKALLLGVLPYLPGDLIKLVLATTGGLQVRKRLQRAGLL